MRLSMCGLARGSKARRSLPVFVVAALFMPMLLGIVHSPRAYADGGDGYRSDWTNLPADFPTCDPYAEYPINYVSCLPDNTEPTADLSLVVGQLVYSDGQDVDTWQGQGPAGVAELAEESENQANDNPYDETGDNVNEQDPAFGGWFAYLIGADPDSPGDTVTAIAAGGTNESWVYQPSYNGYDTPFGDGSFGHPSDPDQWEADVSDVGVTYDDSTDLGQIVLPSPPSYDASCNADATQPEGTVICEADDTPGTQTVSQDGEGEPGYSWVMDTNADDPDNEFSDSGGNFSYTFPDGDGDYPVLVTADAGGGWTSEGLIDADTYPCGGTCLGVNTSTDMPVNPDDGNQHAVQGTPYTITSTVTNESDTDTLQDVTPGALTGSPSTVTDGPNPPSIDELGPGDTATFTWAARFSDIDSGGSNSDVFTPFTATDGERQDSSPGSETDFITDASGLAVSVTGPASNPTVGDLVPFNVSVTNNSGSEMTDVGPTNATLLLTQLNQQGQTDSGTIDFDTSTQNPTPIPDPDPTLAAGATKDFTVDGVATVAGTDTVDISVSGANPDSSTDTAAGTADVTVAEQQPQPAAGFSLSVVPPNPSVGQSFTVYANLANNSSTSGDDLNVDSLGNGLVFPTSGVSGGTASESSGYGLSPGSSTQAEVYSGTAAAAGTFNAEAYLTYQYNSDTNSTSTTAKTSFTVGPTTTLTPQTISFTDPPGTTTYGDAAQSVDPSASSGLAVTLVDGTPSVCSVTGTGPWSITPVAGGTCVVQARQAGDGTTWAPAASVTQAFTINRQSQSITFPALSTVTLPASGTAVATSSVGLPVTFSSLTPSVCEAEPGGGLVITYYGTCTIEADQAGSSTTLPAPSVTQSFTVNPSPNAQPQVITFTQPHDMTYGDEPQAVNPTAPGGYVTLTAGPNGTCFNSSDQIHIEGSGTCTVTATQAGDGISWLAATPVTYQVNIAPATLTLTGPTFFTHAGDTFQAPSWPVGVSGLVYNDGAGKLGGYEACTGPFTTSDYTTQTITGSPGAYPTNCSGFTATGYQIAYKTGTITILAASTPEPPTAVVAQPGVDQSTVSWTAPNDTVDSYTVTASPGGQTCHAPTTAGCTVTGLTAGTEYTFSVKSTAASVTGPASAPSNPVLVTSLAPESPTSITGAGEISSQLTVGPQMLYEGLNFDGFAQGRGTATLAQYAGDPAAGFGTNGQFFDVHLTPGSTYDDLELSFCDGTTSQTLEWWDPTAQSYEPVTPGPTAGNSQYDNSACSIYTLTSTSSPSLDQLEGTVFGLVSPTLTAPTSVNVTGPASVVAGSSYSASAAALGANPYATYTLGAGAPSWLGIGSTTGAITGSVPATGVTSFSYSVTATNSQGHISSATQTVKVTTSSTAPGAPTKPKAAPGNHQATVSWSAPASNGGSALTGYAVTSSPGSKTCTTTALSCTVTGLTDGTSYTFTVKAKNTIGTGAASVATAPVVPGLAVSLSIKQSVTTAAYGDEQKVTFDVTAKALSGALVPTGAITLGSDKGTVCKLTLASGKASCTLKATQLAVGTLAITATYSGSTTFSSSATTTSITVAKADSATALKLSATTATVGKENTETFSVVVSPQFAGLSASGTVTIDDASGKLCTITLSKDKGSCALTASQLKAGSYAITASYGGTADLKASTSAKATLTVKS